MIVQSGMQELLKYNDKILYNQQIKTLSKVFNNDLSTILYVLYYILFIYDESIICLMSRYFMHFFISTMIEDLNHNEELMPGVTRGNALNQLSRPNILNTQNNDNEHDPDSPIDEIGSLFDDWSDDKKRLLVYKLILFFLVGWSVMVIYQILFCLGNVNAESCYEVFGSLNSRIRESSYNDMLLKDSKFWTVRNAFTNGDLLLNLIGDMKFRSKFLKLSTILVIDFLVISLQLISLSLNYGIGLGIIDRFDNEDDELDDRKFDGLQGRTLVFKLNPIRTISVLVRGSRNSTG